MIAFAVWIINDLPRAVPRNIGRRLEVGFTSLSSTVSSVPQVEAERIASDVRKILRLTSFDLQESHRIELEKFTEKVKTAESQFQVADTAMKLIEDFLKDVDTEKGKVTKVELETH